MPTSREIVANRPLGGNELLEIMVKDFRDLLSRDGIFSHTIAYRRVAYRMEFRLMLDNPMYPEHKGVRESRNPAVNLRPDNPLVNMRQPPIENPTGDALIVGAAREKMLNSPNQARLLNGLPVTTQVLDRASGQIKTKNLQYDTEGVPPIPHTDTDTTGKARVDWGAEIPAQTIDAEDPVIPTQPDVPAPVTQPAGKRGKL